MKRDLTVQSCAIAAVVACLLAFRVGYLNGLAEGRAEMNKAWEDRCKAAGLGHTNITGKYVLEGAK